MRSLEDRKQAGLESTGVPSRVSIQCLGIFPRYGGLHKWLVSAVITRAAAMLVS